jgi:hypothetical protein
MINGDLKGLRYPINDITIGGFLTSLFNCVIGEMVKVLKLKHLLYKQFTIYPKQKL